jgi:hypothetical protein
MGCWKLGLDTPRSTRKATGRLWWNRARSLHSARSVQLNHVFLAVSQLGSVTLLRYVWIIRCSNSSYSATYRLRPALRCLRNISNCLRRFRSQYMLPSIVTFLLITRESCLASYRLILYHPPYPTLRLLDTHHNFSCNRRSTCTAIFLARILDHQSLGDSSVRIFI